MTSHHGTPGGFQDLHRLADATEDLGNILGNLPLGDVSKETVDALLGTGPRLVATASVLRQAARETSSAIRFRADIADASYALNRAVDEYTLHQTRLTQIRQESREDRLREHDLDARLEALADDRGGWRR